MSRSSLAAATAGVLGAPHLALSADALLFKPGQRPNKIIHIVSDGMSMGTLTCSDIYSQLTRKRALAWTSLFKNPLARVSLMNTRSLNSAVTDSSAAASAWGSGSRVVNGAVNTLPDGKLLTPLYALMAQAGWATGLVTTAEITHATPAGFAVAVKSRGNSEKIAAQYFDRKVDVLLGGGRPFFSPRGRKDKRDLRADFKAAGYTVVLSKDELEKAPLDTKILGTFAPSHLPYTIDHRADKKLLESTPTIAQMTKAALARLERHDQFILQVEGGRIDHAAHNSDAPSAVHDQIALDEAIDLCLEFQRKHPDTLIVMTTDHGNSNLGLNGMGDGYRTSSQRFAMMKDVKASYPEILKRIEKAGEKVKVPKTPSDAEDKLDVPDPMAKVDPKGKVEGEKNPEKQPEKDPVKDPDKDDPKAKEKEKKEKEKTAEEKAKEDKKKYTAAEEISARRVPPQAIVDIVAEWTGYKMSVRRAGMFSKYMAGQAPAMYDQMNSTITQFGQLMGNRFGVGWTGNTHTADYVSVVAIGPGSELFNGLFDNTEIFVKYTKLAGIDFKNPSQPLIASADLPEAGEVEFHERYAWA